MCGWRKWLPVVFWYFQGGITIVIAVLAVWIAGQQWKTSAQKLKMDLFDKRYRVFEAVKKVVVSMFTRADVSDEEFLEFTANTKESGFLFEDDVVQYLDDVARHMNNLRAAKRREREPGFWESPQPNRQAVADEGAAEVQWAFTENQKVADKFKKYLDFSKL